MHHHGRLATDLCTHNMSFATTRVLRNKPEVREIHGLEVPSCLTYHGWEPGGAYTKSLVLKNVVLKTQRLKFKISSKNFYSEVSSHPVVLSAGNSCTFPVTFRPLGKSEIIDKVEITTLDGNFSIPLVAVLPKPKILLPSSIQLAVCEVQSAVHLYFNATNSGLVSISFYWKCKDPFQIYPGSGTLPPKGSLKFQATFKPMLACVFKVSATCFYGDQYEKSTCVLLEGIGKYPHLLVKESHDKERKKGISHLVIAFGTIPLGTEVEKSIDLVNVSPVPASFKIDLEANTKESMCKCSKTHGIVPPLKTLPIKISCSPTTIGQRAVSHFILNVKGSLAKTKITCTAQPIGPKVVLDKECVNFGNVACGNTSCMYLHLTNYSSTTSVYQFLTDSFSVFKVENPFGKISGRDGATVTVKVVFNPCKAIPYHKTVTCLVFNQDEPLVVHFIGSAFTENIKPAQLTQQHISLYKSIVPTGLSKLAPNYLHECVENGSLSITNEGELVPDTLFHPSLEKLAPSTVESSYLSDYFQYGSNKYVSHHFLLESDEMQFGFVSPHHSSEGKILTITNLTQGTIVCNWMINCDDMFQVVPHERELPSQSTGAFAVSFWPKEHNNLFCKELECFVYYKELSDSKFSDSRLLIPPWCLTVTVTGHSFSSSVEPFQPNFKFNSNMLMLPDTVPGKPTYQSFVAENKSETPLLYSFEFNDDSVGFCIKPKYGLVPSKSHQLFLAEFLPSNSQRYSKSIMCVLNDHTKFTKTIQLTGVSESPRLVLDKKESAFFKPTCIGGASDITIDITNPCGLPLRFAWQMKGPSTNKCLKITPRSGVLQPNENLSITLTFTPDDIKRYHFATVVSSLLLTDSYHCSNGHRYRVPLCVYGEGIMGTIECLNPKIDCGYIAIGTSSKTAITLRNSSACTLKIKLGVKQVIEPPDEEAQEIPIGSQLHGMEFDFTDHEIEPLSSVIVPVTLRPSRTAKFTSCVSYQYNDNEKLDKAFHELCSIHFNGAYPTLSVIDVQGDGIACSLSKVQIWKMLQLSNINHHLCEDPSPSELRYTISTRHSTSRRTPILTHAVLDLNFCPGTLDNKAQSTYCLMVTNPGQIEAEWAFKFPMDMYLEPEFWAETGRIDPVEQHEIDVVKNSIFSITPKQGTLGPGETVMVKLSYYHSQLGTNRLPVLLKINRGREIMLNFVGITSSPGTPCITLITNTHTFSPVPLDTIAYPIQVFEIYNAGDVMGSYIIDTSPLDELKKLSYNMSVLDCLQPHGKLPPRQTTKVEFLFSPLEAKVYMIDLSIHFTDGHTQVINFIGEGIQSCRSVANRQLSDCIPLSTTLTLPSQLIQLSQNKLVLGDIPLFAIIQHIVFMRNLSKSTVSYQWNIKDNVVSIHPSFGYIQPGKSAQLRVTFHSENQPSIYNMDMLCYVINESEMRTYQKSIKQFKKIGLKNSDEFLISDKLSHTKHQSVPGNEETYEEWTKKDMHKKSKTRPRERQHHTNGPPTVPQPHILHLSIIGSTYSIPDYCKMHGSKFDSFKIDYNSIMTKTNQEGKDINEKKIMKVSETEMNVVENALAECLRDLEKDTNFLASITTIANEKIPYFSQFTMKVPSSSDVETSIKESASRHIYAVGLEQIPSLVSCMKQDDLSYKTSDDNDNEEEEISFSDACQQLASNPPQIIRTLKYTNALGRKIKRLTEFQSFTELTLENVLLNVIKEVNKGEISLTAPVYIIAKPPS